MMKNGTLMMRRRNDEKENERENEGEDKRQEKTRK